jgi:8-oxo-dGTP diphosphatase
MKKTLEPTTKKATLCFLLKDDEILLAMKKRGFGKGKRNGVGGKIDEGETSKQAAVREAEEEINVKIKEEDLTECGRIKFYFRDNPDWNFEVDVYTTRNWEGEPEETDEMKPKWFSIEDIPYDEMWLDDAHWLPLVLGDKKIDCEFCFNKEGTYIESHIFHRIK